MPFDPERTSDDEVCRELLTEFLDEACEYPVDDGVLKVVFRASFHNYCERNELPIPEWSQFKMSLEVTGGWPIESDRSGYMARFSGVRVVDGWETFPKVRSP